MRKTMVGLVVAAMAWGGLAVPSAAALELSGDEVVVWEPSLFSGLNSSTTLDITQAGDLVLSAAGTVSATDQRTLTDGAAAGETALDGSDSATHDLYVASAAGMDGTLTWTQGVRATEVDGAGQVAGGQTVVESFTPQVAGPASFAVDWDPEKVTGEVTRTSGGIATSQQQSASSTANDPPDWFEVNAKVDGDGNPAPVQGTLTWEQPTVPSRNLDLHLTNVVTGETWESAQLTGDTEQLSVPVDDAVTLSDGHIYSFEVRNRSTESHDYTLAWEYHRLAEVHVAVYDPDGQLVEDATGAVHGQTVTFDVPGHDDAASRQKEDDPSAPISRHDHLGLRLKSTNWDALPFNDEGWGVSDSARGTAGYVPGGFSDPVGLSRIEASYQPDRVVTNSRAGSLLVRHTFEESPDANLVQVTTEITNTSFQPTDVTYRRHSNWTLDFSNDFFPGFASSWERVTVATPPPRALPSEIVTIADGNSTSVSRDPRVASDDSSFSNEIGLIEDYGPDDLGTTFDIGFYNVGYYETVRFTQYYGAAATESEALDALRTVGAETWAFGQDADTAASGTPHTFVWGYRR